MYQVVAKEPMDGGVEGQKMLSDVMGGLDKTQCY